MTRAGTGLQSLSVDSGRVGLGLTVLAALTSAQSAYPRAAGDSPPPITLPFFFVVVVFISPELAGTVLSRPTNSIYTAIYSAGAVADSDHAAPGSVVAVTDERVDVRCNAGFMGSGSLACRVRPPPGSLCMTHIRMFLKVANLPVSHVCVIKPAGWFLLSDSGFLNQSFASYGTDCGKRKPPVHLLRRISLPLDTTFVLPSLKPLCLYCRWLGWKLHQRCWARQRKRHQQFGFSLWLGRIFHQRRWARQRKRHQ